jgi:tRNA A-37 threonylcarbamoyl transferase component Bud32
VRNGIRAPDVRVVDVESGIIVMEWIEGHSVRALLGDEEQGADSGKTDILAGYGTNKGMWHFTTEASAFRLMLLP